MTDPEKAPTGIETEAETDTEVESESNNITAATAGPTNSKSSSSISNESDASSSSGTTQAPILPTAGTSKTCFPVHVLSETYDKEKHKAGKAEFIAMMELLENNGGWEVSFGHKKKGPFLLQCNVTLHAEGGKLN